eukprot:9834-Heterococcus_DN1.PRE.13
MGTSTRVEWASSQTRTVQHNSDEALQTLTYTVKDALSVQNTASTQSLRAVCFSVDCALLTSAHAFSSSNCMTNTAHQRSTVDQYKAEKALRNESCTLNICPAPLDSTMWRTHYNLQRTHLLLITAVDKCLAVLPASLCA